MSLEDYPDSTPTLATRNETYTTVNADEVVAATLVAPLSGSYSQAPRVKLEGLPDPNTVRGRVAWGIKNYMGRHFGDLFT
jgi:hypothetical protein